jgi:activator of Hsp90 ATPase-like protein
MNLRCVTSGAATVRSSWRAPRSLTPSNRRSPAPSSIGTKWISISSTKPARRLTPVEHEGFGGTWRFVMVAIRGFEVGFHGEYRELVENERIVCTEVYEGMPEAPALNTITFTEVDGRTTLSVLVEHTRREHRDAHIDSGMEAGMQEAMDLLEQVAISLL